MKMILKVLVLPVLLFIKVACLLGNLLTNISSYVIGLLLLGLAGCAVYCIVKAMWTSLLILVILGLAAMIAVFLLVWMIVKVELISSTLVAFIRS